MKFSIITPSYNMLDYLKLCSASIKDQKEVEYEHIVIDGNSTDGTKEWMLSNVSEKSKSENDKGMYDAINKGFNLADGDIVSYLNCDEQYLPGTLKKIESYFINNPDVDLVFGHTLIIDASGNLLSFRKAYKPRYSYIISSILYNLSCTMFFRRRIIKNGFQFDIKLKDVGDADFVLRILKAKYKATYIDDYLSVFTWTGKNMSTGENAIKEKKELRNSTSYLLKTLSPVLNLLRIGEKFISGAYYQKFPIDYSIYLYDNIITRTHVISKAASFRWPSN